MIPWEQFKESSFYQLITEEGREEGALKTAVEVLRLLAAKRSPGLQLGDELERSRFCRGFATTLCGLERFS